MASDTGSFGKYCLLHSFQTKRTPFLFKHFPFYPPHSGMCRLIPLHVCNLWIDLQSWICFIIPFPLPASPLTPFGAPFGPYSSKLKSYLRIALHALDSFVRQMFKLLFIPLPPSSLNILSLALVRTLIVTFTSSSQIRRWDRRGLRVARRVVITCALRVCNVCGLW